MALQKCVEAQVGTQAEKAKRLGINQPRLNDLLRGRIDKFSLDALVNIASRADLKVDIYTSARQCDGAVLACA